jgi:hypothetical protein
MYTSTKMNKELVVSLELPSIPKCPPPPHQTVHPQSLRRIIILSQGCRPTTVISEGSEFCTHLDQYEGGFSQLGCPSFTRYIVVHPARLKTIHWQQCCATWQAVYDSLNPVVYCLLGLPRFSDSFVFPSTTWKVITVPVTKSWIKYQICKPHMVYDIWDLHDLINTTPFITDDLKETPTSIFSVHSKRETNFLWKVCAYLANYKMSHYRMFLSLEPQNSHSIDFFYFEVSCSVTISHFFLGLPTCQTLQIFSKTFWKICYLINVINSTFFQSLASYNHFHLTTHHVGKLKKYITYERRRQ